MSPRSEVMRRSLQTLTTAAGERIALDLRGVELIDSVGISSVVEQDARAAATGARLELVTNARVDRILELTGLAGCLAVYDPSGRQADAQPSAAGSSREAEPAGVGATSRALRPASAPD